MTAPLSQGVGYGVVLGVGFAFAAGMIAVSFFLGRYQKEVMTSEEFGTAGRSVKSGLIASAVISSWTWTTTLLVSTAQVYNYGVAGGIYYASGCGVVCFIFALLAMEVKRKAPGCHTYLELIRVRYGKLAHLVFMFFALAVNILVTVELLNGASVVVNYLTGMHIVASTFLVILPVTCYTLFGGLKSTFLTDYLHTIVMLTIALVFLFNAYTTNSKIGSPSRMYDLLTDLAQSKPVEGNKDGSYLTIRSHGGGIFLAIAFSSAITPICLDQGYWQKSLASTPSSVLPGYLMGGIAWYGCPFGLATVMGLSARVLETETMTSKEVSAGLVLPKAAVLLMGRNGAACALLLVLMSVTSAASAEMVAASTVFVYDIYKPYLNPRASGKQLIFMTHVGVVVFVLAMVGIAIGLYYAGVDLGWLFDLIAVVAGGAFIPAVLTLFWSGLSKWSAIISAILGSVSGVVALISISYGLLDSVNMVTTNSSYSGLGSMLISTFSPLIWVPLVQLFTGNARYDFEQLRTFHITEVVGESDEISSTEKEGQQTTSPDSQSLLIVWDDEEKQLDKYIVIARIACAFLILSLLILFPMPMYGSGYVFSKPFFTGWTVIHIIWIWCALFLVGVVPVWQGRAAIAHVCRCVFWDISGRSYKVRDWQRHHPEELHKHFEAPKAL